MSKSSKTSLLFLPDTLKTTGGGFLEGVYCECDEFRAFYVTSDVLNKNKQCEGDFIGYVKSDNETISLNNFINDNKCDSLVKIGYKYNSFKKHEPLAISEHSYGIHIKNLCLELQKKKEKNSNTCNILWFDTLLYFLIIALTNTLKICEKITPIFEYSATLSHFYNNLTDIKWFLTELRLRKCITAKLGNLLVSKLFDIILGVFLLQWFMKNQEFIIELLDNGREASVENFKNLLTYLMGSPIGLKLNYSFNRSLGTFFFYHISLWKIFLTAMHPLIKIYFRYLILPGAFGFSYQIAMISDVISIATFHLYCIYVYAARLTHLQLRGLLSLWRLFIGRKNNPLRQRIDTCNYTNNQLFIGTLAFTILLFLLPTTAMYYTVFTTLRLFILIMDQCFGTARNLLHSLPFYVFFLWLIKSPQITGPVHFTYLSENTFRTDLDNLSLWQCIRTFTYKQKAMKRKSFEWEHVFFKVFSGALL